jgi:hypothetical protein
VAGSEPTTKRCPRCGEAKPLDEFNPSERTTDGLDVYCRPCRKEYNLIYVGNRRRGYALDSAFEPRFP